MNISVTKHGEEIRVECPYNDSFIQEARLLKGKWNKPFWCFESRDEVRVRAILAKIFGSDSKKDEDLGAQIWEPCERCGREPIYLKYYLCEVCSS